MEKTCLVGLLLAGALAAARPTPRLLLTAEDFSRIEAAAAAETWAAAARSAVVTAAQAWPASHNQRYGLAEWTVPPEGGQWTHYYVCPVHGSALQNRAPGQNICPVDNRNFTGWPYDQVIYSYRHSANGTAARDNGLAYRFTNDARYARAAAQILLAYADVYSRYTLKDSNNRQGASAARVFAQTLDESVWLIPVAWAYDLIADSGVLTSAERAHIEQDLLRAAAAVIRRYNAGISNWQSWHNGAIGAVGFALDDAELIQLAIEGPSGFRFQMKNSVLSDGTWYEGAWSYHFYALDPHTQLAEMAARGGIDLWAEPGLRGMFEAPLRMAGPDLNLPPFNDSGPVSLLGSDRLYEMAYARYRDPIFAAVLGKRSRGREALLWGSPSLPAGELPALGSAVFPASGNAMLRAAASDHYLAFKFGPHGGGHGHYDKLGFVSYGRGGVLAVDPGTQPYAAPTHNTWDKQTVAHNTVVVDETTQGEATGELKAFAALAGMGAVRASAGPAYRQASLERTLILAPEYVIDSFRAESRDGAEHRFDWVYHNNGRLSPPLAMGPAAGLPARNGYQHLTGAQSAATEEDWKAVFDINDGSAAYGSVFASPSAIQARFEHSREQSVSGGWSGRMSYDFTAAQGYVVYTTPVLAVPAEVPSGISLMVYGDGSGHRLVLRIYDATDERFVHTVGNVDWTGWRAIEVPEPARWSHYLGNDDGVIDAPIRTVAVEFGSVGGGPLKGAIYVDDIRLRYPLAGELTAADFERTLRNLRVWMLGAPGTTVVAGNGLGPDLQKPVPFVMARRRGAGARFVSLLEPYGESPGVAAFHAGADDSYAVSGEGFEDRVTFDAAGALRWVRRRGGEIVRVGLAGATTLTEGFRTWIALEAAGSVEVEFADGGALLQVTGDATGQVRVYAPSAKSVRWNGKAAPFEREGEYVVMVRPVV